METGAYALSGLDDSPDVAGVWSQTLFRCSCCCVAFLVEPLAQGALLLFGDEPAVRVALFASVGGVLGD